MSLPEGELKGNLNQTPFIYLQSNQKDFNNLRFEVIENQKFFSSHNQNYLQEQIHQLILKKGYRIAKQDEIELNNVMKEIYAFNSNDSIKILNQKVLKKVIPMIMDNIQSYLMYLRDSQGPIRVLDRPENTSIKGFKSS